MIFPQWFWMFKLWSPMWWSLEMGLWGSNLVRWGHEDGVLMLELVSYKKRYQRTSELAHSPSFSLPLSLPPSTSTYKERACKDTARNQPPTSLEESPHQKLSCPTPCSDFQPPNCEKEIFIVKAAQSMIFCSGSLRQLGQQAVSKIIMVPEPWIFSCWKTTQPQAVRKVWNVPSNKARQKLLCP